jgi:hypothetical protein
MIRFSGFIAKKNEFNRTEPVQFEPEFGSVWIFKNLSYLVRLVFVVQTEPNWTMNKPTSHRQSPPPRFYTYANSNSHTNLSSK